MNGLARLAVLGLVTAAACYGVTQTPLGNTSPGDGVPPRPLPAVQQGTQPAPQAVRLPPVDAVESPDLDQRHGSAPAGYTAHVAAPSAADSYRQAPRQVPHHPAYGHSTVLLTSLLAEPGELDNPRITSIRAEGESAEATATNKRHWLNKPDVHVIIDPKTELDENTELFLYSNSRLLEPISNLKNSDNSRDFRVTLAEGTNVLQAVLRQKKEEEKEEGDTGETKVTEKKYYSDPVTVEIRTGKVKAQLALPASFAYEQGPHKITIQFDFDHTLDEILAADPSKYTIALKPNTDVTGPGPSSSHPKEAKWFESGNSVALTYDTLPPGVYLLTVTGGGGGIKDVYGNELLPTPGQASNAVFEISRGIVRETPSVMPGLKGTTGDNIEFPEFVTRPDLPEGFNPGDHVETRVARLYYFRDAHRVAQIINRDAKSYNRAAVDAQRQVADKARSLADDLTEQRRRRNSRPSKPPGSRARRKAACRQPSRTWPRPPARHTAQHRSWKGTGTSDASSMKTRIRP